MSGDVIRIFTPGWADAAVTNAQSLTTKEVVARLDPARFHVTLYVGELADERIAARPNTRLLRYRRRGNSARLLPRLLLSPPDVYFFPRGGPIDDVFLAFHRALRFRTAVVAYVVSASEERRYPFSPTVQTSIRQGAAVVGNSRFVAERIRRHYDVEAEVIHDGIDRRWYVPPARPRVVAGRRPTVLFAGALRDYKRPDVVIRQAARRPDVDVRIAGDGDLRTACVDLVARLGCHNVTFLGHLPQNRLGDEMRRADVFLFPSVFEGHPQVLAQAAGCGLPSIAMQVYRPEYVVDRVTGFVVATDADLEARLDALLDDPVLRAAMSAAAYAHSRRFEWDDIVPRWEAVFERVGRRGPGRTGHASESAASHPTRPASRRSSGMLADADGRGGGRCTS